MSIYNPDICATNEVRQEAEEAGVLREYLDECVGRDKAGHCLSIAERRELIKQLVEEKEGKV